VRKMVTKIAGILSVAMLATGLVAAQPKHRVQKARAINPPGSQEGLPFSNGILVGNTLYVAGTEGTDSHGKLEPGIEAQTRAALGSIRKIVEAAGMTMGDVVAVNVYLADIQEFGKMNSVYKGFFQNPMPTRTTVQVAGLVNGARIEISAIAVKHQ
jgi:2-iminobutanoate/2-iminopropanoate deaminase